MIRQNLSELLIGFEQALDAQVAETPLKVLVLGPSMRSKDPGGALRRHIHSKARTFGVSVLGELAGLVEASRRKFGAGHNLSDYESFLAGEMDAIVIIPASPGSFAELGLFALADDICKKSLLLFSKASGRGKSFINLGPRRSYGHRGATVESVDYADVDTAWDTVRDFLEVRRTIKITERRRVGSAAR